MGYYKNLDQIWKIWNSDNKKLRKVTFIIFEKTFDNKSSKELLKYLANNFNQESNTKNNTDLDFYNSEPILQI